MVANDPDAARLRDTLETLAWQKRPSSRFEAKAPYDVAAGTTELMTPKHPDARQIFQSANYFSSKKLARAPLFLLVLKAQKEWQRRS